MHKRFCVRFIACFMALASFLMPGCTKPVEQSSLPESALIGVIETRGTEEKSRISFYDNSLNKVNELPLPYASLGQPFCDPLVYDQSLFLIPQGKYNVKDGHSALKIDLNSLSEEKFAINQPAINSVATNGKYIFTCNTVNASTVLTRCTVSDKSVTEIVIENTYIPYAFWHSDRLYTFGIKLDSKEPFVRAYDENLNFIKAFDSSVFGGDVYKAIPYRGNIYFTSSEQSDDGSNGYLAVLNTEDGSISKIPLAQEWPWGMAIYDNKLYVSHCDIVQPKESSYVSIVDLDTGKVEGKALDHAARHICIADGSLYVLGNWEIFRYDVEKLTLTSSTNIPKFSDEEISLLKPQFSYLSGMFSLR